MKRAAARVRFVTWNVRHCRGLDQRVLPARIAGVLGALDADVVALQEIDVRRERSFHVDQATWIADQIGLTKYFCTTVRGAAGLYGHVLLSRLPLLECGQLPLPILPGSEPRAAIDVRFRLGSEGVRVIATHLGLSAPERAAQARTLAARIEGGEPTVLLGDLNAGPGHVGFLELVAKLSDPLAAWPLRARATWPSPWPVRALDHVLISRGIGVRATRVLNRGAALFASDHRPVVVDAVIATTIEKETRGSRGVVPLST